MKTFLPCFIAFLTFSFGWSRALAAEPAINQVTFDFLVVEMPEQSVLPLLPELRDRHRAAGATERILKMVAEKKAALIAWQVLTTKSGQRAVAEQIDEFRYATEYDPPGKTLITDRSPETAGTTGAPLVPVDPKEARPSPPNPERITTTDSVHEGIPSSFETRNVGVTLEIESNIRSDRKHIDINLVPQHVRLLGMEKVVIENREKGTKVEVQQPRFATHKVTTSLTVETGDYTLIGTFKVPDKAERMELFILHSEIESPTPPPVAKPPKAR